MTNESSTKKLLKIIPECQLDAVFGQDICDIDYEFIGFVGIYDSLSKIIPKHFTVIDFGCSYNAQCFFFDKHKKYIAVDISKVVKFKSKNCEIFEMPISEFIERHSGELDKSKTFAICSYVPPWHDDNIKLVRENFTNVFTFYPAQDIKIVKKKSN